jgi:hypothetical protein
MAERGIFACILRRLEHTGVDKMWDFYMRATRHFVASFAAGLLACVLASAARAASPSLKLDTLVSQPTLQVGQETTVAVRATITGGAANDGLTAFDLDLFPLDKSGMHFVGLASVDPAAVLLSAGTFEPASGGLRGISAVYNPVGVAIGSTVTLFTVKLHADGVGDNSVSTGLSVFPNGVGIPFQLNVSGDYAAGNSNFTVLTGGAVAPVHIIAVPEPGSVGLGLAVAAASLLRRGKASKNSVQAISWPAAINSTPTARPSYDPLKKSSSAPPPICR